MSKNNTSLRSEAIFILLLVGLIPFLVIFGLSLFAFFRLNSQIQSYKIQELNQAQFTISSQLRQVDQLIEIFSQSQEIASLLHSPESLRSYSENLFDEKISIQLKNSNLIKNIKVFDAKISDSLYVFSEDSSLNEIPESLLNDNNKSSVLIDEKSNLIIIKKMILFDDQYQLGPSAKKRGEIYTFISIEEIAKPIPNLKFITYIPSDYNPNFIKLKIFESEKSYFIFIISMTIVIIFFVIILALGSLRIHKKMILPIINLTNYVRERHCLSDYKKEENEIDELKSTFNLYLKFIEESNYKLLQNSKDAAKAEQARQVAHDIRSPLSALSLISSQLSILPEDTRIIIQNAISRINDIANNLLNKGTNTNDSESQILNYSQQDQFSKYLLSPLIDSIVSEKRIQYRENSNISISAMIDQSYGIFANANSVELKRAISNLVNNSVEAFPNNSGSVVISITKNETHALISIVDNGIGIPDHILDKIGTFGFSFGKDSSTSGNGLGVYHAKKMTEDSGGIFKIQSSVDSGTTIVLSFPLAPPPVWFVERLFLKPNFQIISLDDDITIHQIWRGRFSSFNISGHNINHLIFTSGTDFKRHFATINNSETNMQLFLIDYELLNQNQTGLDIIEELNIAPHSILVTSRFEESKLLDRCNKLDIKLIPKAMAGYVPIEIKSLPILYDWVLIDDDILIHQTWSFASKEAKKDFLSFFAESDFMDACDNIDKSSSIYVDANLGNGKKGEDLAKKLHTIGFVNIFIATGNDPEDVKVGAFIKGIIGKYPPTLV